MISWLIRKQSGVALSIAEEEYITACSTDCESMWIWKLLSDIFTLKMDVVVIICDKTNLCEDDI